MGKVRTLSIKRKNYKKMGIKITIGKVGKTK